MTDWKSLRHAYGDASDVPALLGQLSPDPRASAWDEIWSRLCHQGTVYSASFAALPHLLLWAQARSPLERGMVLPLAGAIIASRDVFSGAETRQAAVDATASGLEQAGLEALEEPALTPSDFIHVAQAVLACRGDALWGEHLDRLASAPT